MKIDELDYNRVAIDGGDAPTRKSRYKNVAPIVIGDYEVRYKISRDNTLVVTVWDNNKGVAEFWLDPTKFMGLTLYQVDWAGVSPKYQGSGIGKELYKGLIKLMKLNLIQVQSHSPGARKVWLRLAQDPMINAYGFNFNDSTVFDVKPHKTKQELASTIRKVPLYNNKSTGLMLVKKDTSADKFMRKLVEASQLKAKLKDDNVFKVKKFNTLN